MDRNPALPACVHSRFPAPSAGWLFAYAAASRKDIEATTETAAMVVLAAGVLAGIQEWRLRSAEPAVNPLQIGEALKMAALFPLVMYALFAVRSNWGDTGTRTLSMARLAGDPLLLKTAAQATAPGVLSNTLLKLTLSLVLGEGRFRKRAAIGLTALAAASTGAILWR